MYLTQTQKTQNSKPFTFNFGVFDQLFYPNRNLYNLNGPSFDLIEQENDYLLIGDLPGVNKDDLDISLHNGNLTISGKREGKAIGERWMGEFNRIFKLPKTSNYSEIKAELKNGIITVTIPKAEELKPRKIKILCD